MRYTLGTAALALLLAWGSPANAVTFQTLAGQQWTAPDTSDLTLSATPSPTDNQPRDSPCIICGANQPGQTDFGYNMFGNDGNDGNLIYFSSGTVGETLGLDTLAANNYSGSFLTNYLASVGDFDLDFSIGIDMNNTKDAQILESFFFLNLTQHTILASFSPEPGGVALPSIHNGTGYADYLLTGLTLTGINATDQLAFYARISGANDGPDSFFLRATPTVAPVPLPAGVWLFGTALAGLGALKMRRRHRKDNLASS